jgi:hypothetical protein
MDRREKENRVSKQDGKVFEIRDLRIAERYRSDEYILSTSEVAAISPTGHLAIFDLRPVAESGPSFVGRWDGGSRSAGKERDDLDIDIERVSKAVARQFKNGEAGYSGHHSMRVPIPNERVYQVLICIPGKMIFDAAVSFSVHRKIEFSATTATIAAVDFETNLSANEPRSLWSRIKAFVHRIFQGHQ